MLRHLSRWLIVAGTTCALASAAWAHHSQSEFDFSSVVEVEVTSPVLTGGAHMPGFMSMWSIRKQSSQLEFRAAKPDDPDAQRVDAKVAAAGRSRQG